MLIYSLSNAKVNSKWNHTSTPHMPSWQAWEEEAVLAIPVSLIN